MVSSSWDAKLSVPLCITDCEKQIMDGWRSVFQERKHGRADVGDESVTDGEAEFEEFEAGVSGGEVDVGLRIRLI